jgi:hypothetical protein
MVVPRLSSRPGRQVPNLGGALLEAIAFTDLVGAMFIHEGMVASVFDHCLVEPGLIALELEQHMITSGVDELSGTLGVERIKREQTIR